MVKVSMNLKQMEDAKRFISVVQKCEFSVDVVSGQYIIDGKSILGLFSLDLMKPVEVYFRCKEVEDCRQTISDLQGLIEGEPELVEEK